MTDPTGGLTRRGVLRTTAAMTGAGVLGGAGLTGQASGDPGCDGEWTLAAMVREHGHYAHFPLGPESWGRRLNPFDDRDGERRWLAKSTDEGSVRCRVENLPEGRNAGFDLHVGPLGNVHEFTLETRTVTTTEGSSAMLFVGLYLDVDGDGDFFAWNDGPGTVDTWGGFGADGEGAAFLPAYGTVTVDDDTEFQLFHMAEDASPATLGELKAGEVDGAGGASVDGTANAAFYVGVMSVGGGTEEVVVESAAAHTPDSTGAAAPMGRPGDAVADPGSSRNFGRVGEAAEDDIGEQAAASEMTDCVKAAFDRMANRDDL